MVHAGGRPPKTLEEKKRLGNPGKRPLPRPITAIRPVQVEVVNGHGPQTGVELVEALMAAGAGSWIGETDALATLRLVTEAWDERAALRANVEEHGHTQINEKGLEVARPQVAMLREVEKQLSVWLGLLGLNPADRGRLGLAQVQAQKTGLAALREQRALKAGRPAG
jgi:P27 family predicted phage terminase small subunit